MSKPVGWRKESQRHALAAKGIETGQKKPTSQPKYSAAVMKVEEMGLYADCVDVKPRNFDFSEGYGETWNVPLDLTEEEMDNEDSMPMMNYIYPLPDSFAEDMEKRFGKDWPKKIKNSLDVTTIVEIGRTGQKYYDDSEYFMALTGGGMDLSWEICESYMNIGYYPPAHFCNLPIMAGRGEDKKDKETIAACMKSLELQTGWRSSAKSNLQRMLDEGG